MGSDKEAMDISDEYIQKHATSRLMQPWTAEEWIKWGNVSGYKAIPENWMPEFLTEFDVPTGCEVRKAHYITSGGIEIAMGYVLSTREQRDNPETLPDKGAADAALRAAMWYSGDMADRAARFNREHPISSDNAAAVLPPQ